MYYGSSSDRYQGFVDDSTSHKLKNVYWSTKQAMFKKLGKEEDKHVVASDSELDAKLSLFKSVQTTCEDMTLCVEQYLKTIYVLSQAENDMGRFLKRKSSDDKTRAGKMMSAVGKALSHSAQQRLILQNPLTRLEHEVDTFRNRAIGDTAITIQRMESARTEYRGALLWMKNVSNELDPDMFKKLEKFRRVQTQVRKSKSNFDRLKLASMQKVDLLAASRCNMLSQVLAAYQDNLLQFWERTAKTMTTVANSFKGYQFYEFSLLKDLTPETRKLADQTTCTSDDEGENQEGPEVSEAVEEEDQAGFVEKCGLDTKDSPAVAGENLHEEEEDEKKDLVDLFGPYLTSESGKYRSEETEKPEDLPTEEEIDKRLDNLFATDDLLLSENLQDGDREKNFEDLMLSLNKEHEDSNLEASGNDEADFLNDILSLNPSNLSSEFGQAKTNGSSGNTLTPFLSEIGKRNSDAPLFNVNWDSQMTDAYSGIEPKAGALLSPISPIGRGATSSVASESNVLSAASNITRSSRLLPSSNTASSKPGSKPKSTDVDAWMNFFADLTPLGNPDQQSKKSGHVLDA